MTRASERQTCRGEAQLLLELCGRVQCGLVSTNLLGMRGLDTGLLEWPLVRSVSCERDQKLLWGKDALATTLDEPVPIKQYSEEVSSPQLV